MNENTPLKEPGFSLSDSARNYFRSWLPDFAPDMERRGMVAALTYSGGPAVQKDGKTLWQYGGPVFLIAGLKSEQLRAGSFYHLMGHKVWIGEMEEALLEGTSLTTAICGSPNPDELLVIENAPENLLERYFKPGCACDSRRRSSDCV
jgi:hypothetical protein